MSSFHESVDLATRFLNLEVIEICESEVQRIALYRHPSLGKMLVINDEVQHVEQWSALYHEPLVHLPTAFIRKLQNVLILGGGSLFAAAQVFLYSTVKRCTLVDHDPDVLAIMARHYPHAKAVLDEERFVFIKDDAINYLKSCDQKYDLVLNDCFDGVSEMVSIGCSPFQLMAERLTIHGVCADLIYRHVFERDHNAATLSELRRLGSYALSLVAVPEYPGVMHILACWGGKHVTQDLRKTRNLVQRIWIDRFKKPPFEFFNPRFLAHHLYLPPYLMRSSFDSCYKISTETEIFGRRT